MSSTSYAKPNGVHGKRNTRLRFARHRLSIGLPLVLGVFVLYSWRLSDTPVALHEAEVLFALHARAIAQTLHDANGRFLPLYFQMPQIGANVWFHPILVYFTALFVRLLPLTESTVRLPTVCVGITSIVLIYAIARRTFHSERYGLIAATLMAITPAHFIHSRLAMDYLYPVPFILAWLWCLVRFEEEANPSFIVLGTLALGIGVYSYIGALMLMPLYAMMTVIFLIGKYRSLHLTMLWAVMGFCAPLILLLLWIPRYPGVFAETVVRYGVSPVGKLHALRSFLTLAKLEDYLAMYWNLSSPVYLFFVGSSNWVDSTRRAGVFLLPMVVLMTAGLVDFVIGPRSRIMWLVVAGLVTAPIGATFVGELSAVQRELELIPFAVLLAVFGVRRLAQSDTRLWRWVAVGSLAMMPLQFAGFYSDYFGAYRLNSLGWFGPQFRSVVDSVLTEERQRQAQPTVYLSGAIPYGRDHWQFHLARAGREDIFARTKVFDAQTPPSTIPSGSIVVEPLADGYPLDPAAKSPEFTRIAIVTKQDGGPIFWLLRR
jgi:4-amino-4-deoxy-L-arabinose transferase-like glycosyltransferase